ncbi:MAG: hypothetical protein CSYNP_02839 [Syntrophus sp. SKADARSKE-3]|nr:hypothetical protein [Syntrophus sp. SKADARSKE-3]
MELPWNESLIAMTIGILALIVISYKITDRVFATILLPVFIGAFYFESGIINYHPTADDLRKDPIPYVKYVTKQKEKIPITLRAEMVSSLYRTNTEESVDAARKIAATIVVPLTNDDKANIEMAKSLTKNKDIHANSK